MTIFANTKYWHTNTLKTNSYCKSVLFWPLSLIVSFDVLELVSKVQIFNVSKTVVCNIANAILIKGHSKLKPRGKEMKHGSSRVVSFIKKGFSDICICRNIEVPNSENYL